MTMADMIAILSSLILLGIGLPALMLLIRIVFPVITIETSKKISEKPMRTFGRGMVTLILMLIIVAFLSNAPIGPIKLLNFFILMGIFSTILIGAAGLIHLLGNRFQQTTGIEQPTINSLLVSIIFELTLVLPFIGWFVIFPITTLMMFGAASEVILSRISFRRRADHQVAVPAPLS